MMRRPGKCLLPVRMIPWEEDFLHVAAMVIFGSNYSVAFWLKGEPMPDNLVQQLVSEITVKKVAAAQDAEKNMTKTLPQQTPKVDSKPASSTQLGEKPAQKAQEAGATRRAKHVAKKTKARGTIPAAPVKPPQEADKKPAFVETVPSAKPDEPDEPNSERNPWEA